MLARHFEKSQFFFCTSQTIPVNLRCTYLIEDETENIEKDLLQVSLSGQGISDL